MKIPVKSFSRAEKLHQMQAFTECYRTFSDTEICAREAACMRVQFQNILQPIRSNDLLAGRISLLPIGFMPQPTLEKGQGVGYYCDETLLREWAADALLSKEEQRILWGLIYYWQQNTTKARTEHLYTADQWQYMTHGEYHSLPGVAVPLYRLAGTQLHFTRLLENGLSGLRTCVQRQMDRNPAFLNAADDMLAMLQEICLAYAEQAETQMVDCDDTRRGELSEMVASLRRLAVGAPQTFRDAVQLVHLYTLISGTFNYGRMDEYLTAFYFRDLDAGRLDEEGAKRLLKALWRCMQDRNLMMDARVILGGRGRRVADPMQADEFALVVMDVSHEVHDTLPQLTLMCNAGMSPRLWHKAMELLGDGTTYPILYNDDVNIPAFANALKVPESVSTDYIPFGCGEYMLYHKGLSTPSGGINLLALLNKCLTTGLRPERYPFHSANQPAVCYYQTFDEFYQYYLGSIVK